MSDVAKPDCTKTAPAAAGGRKELAATDLTLHFFSISGRNYPLLLFSVLCLATVLAAGRPLYPAVLPALLQVAAVLAAAHRTGNYRKNPDFGDDTWWKQHTVSMAALAGACWGTGAIFWYLPDQFTAQAVLCLAYLGVTAATFAVYAPSPAAYLAHAAFSLGPLAIRLAVQGGAVRLALAAILLLTAAVLAVSGRRFAAWITAASRLSAADVDKARRLAREKAEADATADDARAHERIKTDFIAAIARELRTPLNALTGMAQLLERADLPQAQRSEAQTILEAARGLENLVDDIAAIVDDGETRRADCDAAVAARAVARLMQPMAWEKHLRLSMVTGPCLPRVAASAHEVRHALMKLVENALKFTETGFVEIHVAAVEADGKPCVRFTVSDTGAGVPPEIAPRLFADAPQSDGYVRRAGGLGLGLKVVRHIAEGAGGKIGYESELGGGSSFWFAIPAVEAEKETTEETAPPPANLDLLVFLAGETVHKEVEEILAPLGNRLVFARNGADLVMRAAAGNFDAAIVRADLAAMLAAAPGEKAPILALTAAGERPPAGAAASVAWPCAARRLYAALNALVAAKPGRRKPDVASTPEIVNGETLAALEKAVGAATLIEILKSYIENSEKICAGLAETAGKQDWPAAAQHAQDIVGAASELGLTAVTRRARAFAAAARNGEDGPALAKAAEAVVGEAARTRETLAQLYPALAAA